MKTCSSWLCVLLSCGRDQTCPAERAIVSMLYGLEAALKKLCSKSRCMSHWQSASAAEDTVSRFLYEASSSRRGREGEKPCEQHSDLWVVTSGSSCPSARTCTRTNVHTTASMRHCLHVQRREGSGVLNAVGNASDLPTWKLCERLQLGVPAHKEKHKSRI